MNQSNQGRQGLLKKALLGNAVFSILSGVAIVIANRWLVRFLGLPENVSLVILGIGLIAYAATLLLNARRPVIKITDAWVAVIVDIVWVVGSYVLILVVPFSAGGKWMIALVAELVLALRSCNGLASAGSEGVRTTPCSADI
jgi:hypothetical protein